MAIPNYINCKNKELEVCDYYWHKDCPGTCFYATDIAGYCAQEGAFLSERKRILNGIEELFKEDMKDY